MILQAIVSQLNGHKEVLQQATLMLVQATKDTAYARTVLARFFQWIRSKYWLTPRQKRTRFAQKLREMQWNWRENPADLINNIMASVQLTWNQVIEDESLREELEVALASKLDLSLHLQITRNPPRNWYQVITEIWERVKDSKASADVAEIYMHEGDDYSDSDCDDDEEKNEPQVQVAKVVTPTAKQTNKALEKLTQKVDSMISAFNATATPNNSQRPPLKCYYCHQEGHFKRDCPERQVRGFGQGRGGWRGRGRGQWNQRGGYGGYNNNRNYGGSYNNSGYRNTDPPTNDQRDSSAERVRQNVVREGRPKAAWADPSPVGDDEPALEPACHAEADFQVGLGPSGRWKTETTRAPMMYVEAMAHMANAAPLVPTTEMPRVDFLGQS